MNSNSSRGMNILIYITKECGSGGCGSLHQGMNIWRSFIGCNGKCRRQGCDLLPILVAIMDVHVFVVQ